VILAKQKSTTADNAPPAKKKLAAKGQTAKSSRTRPAAASQAPDAEAIRRIIDLRFDSFQKELAAVKQAIEQLLPMSQDADGALDSSVDSMRRLLSELVEQRIESVVKEVADIRQEAASLLGDDGARVVERLDRLLDGLGAERFEAAALDALDPLIHLVVGESGNARLPDGVVAETLRPGFRSAKGVVLCKAAVRVNRSE
jgi:molecular chaperone GrpE (heat shock protein)